MTETNARDNFGWTPSVYYAESLVDCSLEKAWKILLDYEAWNPSFVGATVTPVRGAARTEGEVVLIKKPLKTVIGEPTPAFYAETIKVVPHRHIAWYVYPTEGNAFRNFCDLGIREAPSGVRFNVYYYAQDQLSGELLIKERQQSEVVLRELAAAFKHYCEATA